ncbi:MAG: DUF58 domain-containing protein [Pseudomonadota bacterium]
MTGFSPLQHEADALGAGLPPLMVAADRLAASISLGAHGRRKAGIGENFWQFRRYGSSDSVGRIDWRQSAKSQHLFVREREWEAAQTVWFWRDNDPGMRFGSGDVTKIQRANLLLLALASLLVRGGERVGLMGASYLPAASRFTLSRIGHSLLDPAAQNKEQKKEGPPATPIARGSRIVWLSDFLAPDVEERMTGFARLGAVGHLVRIVDPAEEDFPYSGRARFEAPRGQDSALFGRAESIGADYRARFAAHGEKIARTATRLGWSATTHRTDHAPQTALIALHAAIGPT